MAKKAVESFVIVIEPATKHQIANHVRYCIVEQGSRIERLIFLGDEFFAQIFSFVFDFWLQDGSAETKISQGGQGKSALIFPELAIGLHKA